VRRWLLDLLRQAVAKGNDPQAQHLVSAILHVTLALCECPKCGAVGNAAIARTDGRIRYLSCPTCGASHKIAL
jgi:translation initiation factor 2 beta subunit (eIF-2beta)/eIF-5